MLYKNANVVGQNILHQDGLLQTILVERIKDNLIRDKKRLHKVTDSMV